MHLCYSKGELLCNLKTAYKHKLSIEWRGVWSSRDNREEKNENYEN